MSEPNNTLDRRRFLKGAGAAALAAFLAACGAPASPTPGRTQRPSLPSSSPAPTSTASPTPSATATASPTPDAFESPLDSPLPTGTESPPPTPTPTPLPTPFPAGPPTKLGLFVAWVHSQVMDLVKTGNVTVIKTLEFDPAFLADIKARSPATLTVGRPQLDQVRLDGDMLAEARRAADAALSLALNGRGGALVDAWEGFNEPVPGDAGQMGKLAQLEAERVRLLSERGVRAVVGNFGTGQPPLEWWPAFRPALDAAKRHGAYLGLHEYSAPTIWYHTNRADLDFRADRSDEGWLTLRYRKVYRDYLDPWGLRLPLILTECGVDG
ncbi:MAG: twin-arginine translocation signal domain-containing protein, partial [Anaerolineae bacterium]|nr:twin-arginine translocation signal domain-containing protein [Anaerolineae bacterium]